MALDRPHREREHIGDLRIAGSLRRQQRNLALTAAERFDLIRPGSGPNPRPFAQGRGLVGPSGGLGGSSLQSFACSTPPKLLPKALTQRVKSSCRVKNEAAVRGRCHVQRPWPGRGGRRPLPVRRRQDAETLACSGRGISFTQAQQVIEDDQFEAALTSLECHVRRRPQFRDGLQSAVPPAHRPRPVLSARRRRRSGGLCRAETVIHSAPPPPPPNVRAVLLPRRAGRGPTTHRLGLARRSSAASFKERAALPAFPSKRRNRAR